MNRTLHRTAVALILSVALAVTPAQAVADPASAAAPLAVATAGTTQNGDDHPSTVVAITPETTDYQHPKGDQQSSGEPGPLWVIRGWSSQIHNPTGGIFGSLIFGVILVVGALIGRALQEVGILPLNLLGVLRGDAPIKVPQPGQPAPVAALPAAPTN